MEIELPHTLKLSKPFRYGLSETAEVVDHVVIEKELTGGDLVSITNEKRDGERLLRMVSALTGWPDPKVKMMSARDFLAVSEVGQSFLPSGLVTGN